MAKKTTTSRKGKSKAGKNVLERINLNAAGIDIGANFHLVAIPEDRAEENVRKLVSVLLTPSGGWRQDLGRVEGARERRHRSQNSAETPEPRRDCRVGG